MSYRITSYPVPNISYSAIPSIILSYLIQSHPILSYPILSYPILSYPILSHLGSYCWIDLCVVPYKKGCRNVHGRSFGILRLEEKIGWIQVSGVEKEEEEEEKKKEKGEEDQEEEKDAVEEDVYEREGEE